MRLKSLTSAGTFPDECDHGSIYALALTWMLMAPLLFFAVAGVVRLGANSHNRSSMSSYDAVATTSEANPVDKAAKLVAYSACMVLVLATFPRISKVLAQNPLLTTLPVLAIASTLWSQFPSQSLFAGIYLALNVGFAIYLMVRFELYEQLQLFVVLGWIVTGASILAAVLVPGYGTAQADIGYFGSWIGLFPHKNACSVTMAFLLSPAFYMRPASARQKVARLAFIILTLSLILMSQSRTGWMVTVALLAYVGVTKGILRLTKKDSAVLVLSLGMGLTVVAMLFVRYYSEIMRLMGKDATLTGRTALWEFTLISIMKAPILGYGFQAFWRGLQGEAANITLNVHWSAIEAHDGYLDVCVGLGALGLGLIICTVLKAYRDGYVCYRNDRLKNVEWYLAIIWVTLISNISETRLMLPHDLVWIMYVMACVGLNNEVRRIRGQSAV
jgi:exopolysaccharide production protein ExoQ